MDYRRGCVAGRSCPRFQFGLPHGPAHGGWHLISYHPGRGQRGTERHRPPDLRDHSSAAHGSVCSRCNAGRGSRGDTLLPDASRLRGSAAVPVYAGGGDSASRAVAESFGRPAGIAQCIRDLHFQRAGKRYRGRFRRRILYGYRQAGQCGGAGRYSASRHGGRTLSNAGDFSLRRYRPIHPGRDCGLVAYRDCTQWRPTVRNTDRGRHVPLHSNRHGFQCAGGNVQPCFLADGARGTGGYCGLHGFGCLCGNLGSHNPACSGKRGGNGDSPRHSGNLFGSADSACPLAHGDRRCHRDNALQLHAVAEQSGAGAGRFRHVLPDRAGVFVRHSGGLCGKHAERSG